MFGIHTALVTPFSANGDLNTDELKKVIEYQVSNGVHGLVACGTTGEAPTLTFQEWAEVVRTTIAMAKGQFITAGVGSNNTATTVTRCEAAKELGVDAGLLVLPYYNKPNPAGIKHHVKAAAGTGLPLVLYHVPGRTAQHLSVDLLAELCDFSGVIAVKEATGDVRYGTDLIARTRVPVLSGDDFSFLGLLAQGGSGCISVVSNVAPKQTVAIYEAVKADRFKEAQAILMKLWPLISALFSDSNPVPAKAAMAHLGLCSPVVRAPLAPWTGPSLGAIVDEALA